MQFHENWKRYFPKLQPIPLTSSVIHRLPLVRELAQWSGTREITKRSFENLLTKGKVNFFNFIYLFFFLKKKKSKT